MPILLIIMSVTLGLAWKARVGRRFWMPAGVERVDEHEMLDACARGSVLVLVSLLGLLALGITYGNVLGANTVP